MPSLFPNSGWIEDPEEKSECAGDARVCAQLLSRVQLCHLWTVAHQALLSMEILQARILEWVAMPPLGDLPDPGI